MGYDLMKIVILDADPAFGSRGGEQGVRSPLSDEPLRALGELEVFRLTRPEETLQRCQGAAVVLSNKVVLGEKEFSQLPELRLVSVLATGVNVIDTRAAAQRGITVCNVPGYSTASTAQHAFALILELQNQVGLHDRGVHEGRWTRAESFSYFHAPLVELDGLTLGVVGLGAIGRQVARIGQAFGMRVIASTRSHRPMDGVELRPLDELLRQSDVVTLHCPLTEQTRHLIDKKALARMKSSALLINCARGPIVDEQALAEALASEGIRGAATDVLSQEPPQADNPLLSAPRCIVTPHIAWATTAARQRLIQISAENIRCFLRGEPQNVVQPSIKPPNV